MKANLELARMAKTNNLSQRINAVAQAKRALAAIVSNQATSKDRESNDFGFYWSRKSDALASSILESFLPGGGIVLDPFFGSGSTLVGAVNSESNFQVVGVDINEMPLEILKSRFELGQGQIQELKHFVETISQRHSERFKFELENAEQVTLKKIIFDRGSEGTVPLEFHLDSQQGKQILTELDGELFRKLSDEYLHREAVDKASVAKIPNRKLIPNSRIAIKEGMLLSDIFTPAVFMVLEDCRQLAGSSPTIKALLGSCLHQCRTTDKGSQSQFPYWIPTKSAMSKNPIEVLLKKFKQIESLVLNRESTLFATSQLTFTETFSALSDRRERAHFLINAPVQNISQLQVPSNSIDIVLTDPPYYDQVAYSEYLAIWEYFCGYKTDLENEVVQSNRRDFSASRAEYLTLMEKSFKNIARMMKENALAVIYFKDSKINNIWDFLKVLEASGLTYLAQSHIPKPSYTYKQNSSKENTVSGDALYVFQKSTSLPLPSDVNEQPLTREDCRKSISKFLEVYGPAKYTQILDDCIIPELWAAGAFDLFGSQDSIIEFVSQNFHIDKASRNVTEKNS